MESKEAILAAYTRLQTQFDLGDLAIMSQSITFDKVQTLFTTLMVLSAVCAFLSASSEPNPRRNSFNFFGLNVWHALTLALLLVTGFGHHQISWGLILLPSAIWFAVGFGYLTGSALAAMCGHREEHLAEAVAAGIKMAHFEEQRDHLPELEQQLVKARATWAKHSPLVLLADPEKPTGVERLYRSWKKLESWKRLAIALIALGLAAMNVIDGHEESVIVMLIVVGVLVAATVAGGSITRKADAVRAFRAAGSQASAAAG